MKAFLLLLGILFSSLANSQTSVRALEEQAKSASGFDKLAILNQLADVTAASNDKKARRYARQAYVLAENFRKSGDQLDQEEASLIVEAMNSFGKSQYERENYVDAKGIFKKSEAIARTHQLAKAELEATTFINRVDSLAEGTLKENFLTRKLTDINIGNMVSNTNNSMGVAVELKMARMFESRNDTAQAISHYQKAADLLRNRGEFDKAEEIETKILSFRRIKELEKQASTLAINELPVVSVPQLVVANQASNPNSLEASDLKNRAQQLEADEDFEAALAYYKQYTELQRKWEKDSLEQQAQRSLVLLEMDRLRQENQIADLNIAAIQLEKEAEVRLRNVLYVGLGAIGIAALIAIVLYFSKRKKHRQLSVAYEDLDSTRLELQDAKQHISKLLEQQVSPEIASALIDEVQEKKKQFVAVMFLDIRGFTPIAEQLEPKELIEYQNNVFGFMIEIIQKYHGNINQFMGDGFMATFGAPKSHGNDVRNAFLAGSEIIDALKETNASGTIPLTKVGIGIHAGHVVTGNVGTESRKQFSVTGNTVIIAARIEQLNKTYGSAMIVSQEVMEYLEQEDTESMSFQPHETHVKGRSEPIKISVFSEASVGVQGPQV